MAISLLPKNIKKSCLKIVQNIRPFYPIYLRHSIHFLIENSPPSIEKDRSAGKKLPIFEDAVISAQGNPHPVAVPHLGLCTVTHLFHLSRGRSRPGGDVCRHEYHLLRPDHLWEYFLSFSPALSERQHDRLYNYCPIDGVHYRG